MGGWQKQREGGETQEAQPLTAQAPLAPPERSGAHGQPGGWKPANVETSNPRRAAKRNLENERVYGRIRPVTLGAGPTEDTVDASLCQPYCSVK